VLSRKEECWRRERKGRKKNKKTAGACLGPRDHLGKLPICGETRTMRLVSQSVPRPGISSGQVWENMCDETAASRFDMDGDADDASIGDGVGWTRLS
jgi:hypothetical protein